jgi:hypothetical protein
VVLTVTGVLFVPPVFYGTAGAGHTYASTGRAAGGVLTGAVGHSNAATGRTGATVLGGQPGTRTQATGRPGRG